MSRTFWHTHRPKVISKQLLHSDHHGETYINIRKPPETRNHEEVPLRMQGIVSVTSSGENCSWRLPGICPSRSLE